MAKVASTAPTRCPLSQIQVLLRLLKYLQRLSSGNAALDRQYQWCPNLLTMQQHITAFMALVRQRERLSLDIWLLEAEQTGLPDLLGFAQGIRRDYAAVVGALEYEWSQGVVEGQVNRIKTIKRQLYGRATLPILKHHVLLSAA